MTMRQSKQEFYTYDEFMSITAPQNKRLELINGRVYATAPPYRIHQELSGFIHLKIGNFLNGKPCKVYTAPFGVFLTDDEDISKCKNIVEPDITIVCDKSKLVPQGCKGAPEFIAEIASPWNAKMDYVHKLNLYDRYGVKEYWIINPAARTITVYMLDGETPEPEKYTFDESVHIHCINFKLELSQFVFE